MPKVTRVPITGSVLEWAIAESGFGQEEIAAATGAELKDVRRWIAGADLPSLTQFRRLVTKIRRPSATFFLSEPPRRRAPTVAFRHPPGSDRKKLSPTERRHLRAAARLQRGISWVLAELGAPPVELRHVRSPALENAERAAGAARQWLGVSIAAQSRGQPADALQVWRSAFEERRVLVFFLPMGKESCRGFSIFDEHAPLIAINTWWRDTARTFTLFHELGHLLTRTDSACLEGNRSRRAAGDEVERWCEAFAASVLAPWPDVERILRGQTLWEPGQQVRNLNVASTVATELRISLRAAALRLVDNGLLPWELYRSIRPASDHKPPQAGGRGRTRPQRKLAEYGRRTAEVFLEGVEQEVIDRHNVADYLDVSDVELSEIESRLVAG